MSRRIDIEGALKNPAVRRQMIAGAVRFLAAHEGRDLTWTEAYEVVDGVRGKAVTYEGWGNGEIDRGSLINPAQVQLCTDRQHRSCVKAGECFRLRPTCQMAKERLSGLKSPWLSEKVSWEKRCEIYKAMDKKIHKVLGRCLKQCRRRRMTVAVEKP